MKPRLLALTLFAACGGGSDPIILVDGPGNDGTSSFLNSKNDMVYVSFQSESFAAAQTPADDQPDNMAAPLTIESTGAKKLAGEMGIGGDTQDDYVERDTFLVTTGADVNQLTVHMQWDGENADLDFVLFEIPATPDDEPVRVASGTLISNVNGEFETFVVQPSTSYWLWAAAFNTNADDGVTPGASPTIPKPYDLSLYGEAFDPANVGACNATEAADGTNNFLPPFGMGTVEATNQTVAGGSNVFCGALDTGHFEPDMQDPKFGIVDIDTFGLVVGLRSTVIVTLTGATPADDAALAGLTDVEYLILDKDGLFFERGFFERSHGAFSATLPTTIDEEGMDTGPKSITIIAFNGEGIATPINYKLKIQADDRDARAPRLTTPADTSEANDN